MSEHCLVLCSCPDAEVGRRLAMLLVERRYAACVNVFPGGISVYRWQGKVESASETLLLAKTRRDRFEAVKGALQEHHPYELPEIIAVPIESGLAPYLDWIDTEVTGTT